MNIARRSLTTNVLRGKIYVVGGIGDDGNVVKEIECNDPAINKRGVAGNTADNLFKYFLVAI